jgi:hypothetical protein
MWVVIEMDGGYSGDPEYPSQVFGPFPSEAAAYAWIRTSKLRKLRDPQEILPPT